jgi:Fe-S cluster biogenesis protein NfuA/nitrite reductase/ring-hydroxylating ferredoxin subunit
MSAQAIPEELLDRVEQLSAAIDELPDAQARELAQELVGAVIAMYGDGLARIVATIGESREAGATILDALAQDGAVSSLLLIHDLYPVPLEQRVNEALDTVRPYMESHGGDVELLGIEDGVARLALQGSCHGCAASQATLELAIKQALDEHAPDLVGLEVAGVAEPHAAANGLPLFDEAGAAAFELPLAHAGPGAAGADAPAHWASLEKLGTLSPGELRALEIDGAALILASVAGALVAYRDSCASCGEPLHDGRLEEAMLHCRTCEVEFDLRRAGRAAGGEPLQLTPVPLLEAGGIRVAV